MRDGYSPAELFLLRKDANLADLVDCQRRVRCMHDSGDAYAAIATDLIAPIYIPYVLYVLKKSRQQGIERIYFLSRDGFILYKIALHFKEDYPNIDIRYLHISRRSLKMPFGYSQTMNVEYQAHYELFVKYLAQEGLFDEIRVGMVDVGWKGTTRMMINSILKGCCKNDVKFFYLSTQDGVLPEFFGDYECFFSPTIFSDELTFVIENYFSAAIETSTIGYTEGRNGIIVPIFDSSQEIYKHIVNTNISIVNYVAGELRKQHLNSNELLLKHWAERALYVLSNLNVRINLTPLLDVKRVDELVFVKKMTKREIFKYVFMGNRNSTYAQASLKLSCSHISYIYLYAIRKVLAYGKKKIMKSWLQIFAALSH